MLQKLNLQLKNGDSSRHSYYLLMDEINDESCRNLIEFILDCNLGEERPSLINLIISSGGGSLHSAFAVIDVMKGSHIPIRTIGLGCIASAGLAIFISGTKGMRILTPNTSIMSHQFSWFVGGKHHELIAATKEVDLTANRILNLYKKSTNLKEDKIKEILLPAHDVWISSDEAKKYGFCDEIKELY